MSSFVSSGSTLDVVASASVLTTLGRREKSNTWSSVLPKRGVFMFYPFIFRSLGLIKSRRSRWHPLDWSVDQHVVITSIWNIVFSQVQMVPVGIELQRLFYVYFITYDAMIFVWLDYINTLFCSWATVHFICPIERLSSDSSSKWKINRTNNRSMKPAIVFLLQKPQMLPPIFANLHIPARCDYSHTECSIFPLAPDSLS